MSKSLSSADFTNFPFKSGPAGMPKGEFTLNPMKLYFGGIFGFSIVKILL
jgi:hypothetical protein